MAIRELNLPSAELQLREAVNEGSNKEVFDPIRNKWVAFTPEEEVRQFFTAWLIRNLGYRKHRMANEMTITVNGMSRRCDTVVFDNSGCLPIAIVEYKAPTVKITGRVFAQAARYNTVLATPVLIVSNGLTHYCAAINPGQPPVFLKKIPDYEELVSIACGRNQSTKSAPIDLSSDI